VCDKNIRSLTQQDVQDIFKDSSITSHTQQKISNILSSVLKSPLDCTQVHSRALCRRCFRLVDELDEVQQRSIVIKSTIEGWYNRSLLKRLKIPTTADIHIGKEDKI
ncbi:hypothetical protein SK128_008115, partial [Halocaridina rubra]